MADHGGGGHGGGGGAGRRASDKGGLIKTVTGNGCLRYLALYIVALVLLAGLAIANGLGLLQKLGLPAFAAPSARTNSANLQAAPAAAAGTGTNSNAGTQGGSTASGGGPAHAPGAMISSLPVAGAQGSLITSMTAPAFYIVQQGETLDTVAAMFGLTRQSLRDYNNLSNDMLLIGQVLYLPAGSYNPVPNTGRNAGGNGAAPSDSGNPNDSTP